MSAADVADDHIGDSAIHYASLTEQVALTAAHQEGTVSSEEAYTLATEIFRRELEKSAGLVPRGDTARGEVGRIG